ncbi:caspase domain-containing protein [Actinoplanes sp. NPDC051343]|uniref:caspase domain-containing protein n=1 Tax=Actinoplanes sp. NPDC051343 TaxID=3363906 RepID=UPI0037BC51B1
MPQVHSNLGGLRDALCDREVGFFTPEHCEEVEQRSFQQVLKAVSRLGREATDTLLVYYCGHAVLDDRDGDSLLLSLPESTSGNEPWSFLRVNDLKKAIESSRAKFRILVLDCCYSGTATLNRLGSAEDSELLARQAKMAGTYVLASSAANETSLAPVGSTYTTFTGALIKLLVRGIPDGQKFIEMHQLFQKMQIDLAGPYPTPAQQNTNDGARLVIARNRAYRPVRVERNRAAYFADLDEILDGSVDLESRIDAVDRIARRAETDEDFLQVLRRITEMRQVPALLRINVVWRLDSLADKEGAVNGLNLLTVDGEDALRRLRSLLTVPDSAEQWPELPTEDEEAQVRPTRLDRLNDDQLWGQLMGEMLLAVGMPMESTLDSISELVALNESRAARLILEGLLRVSRLDQQWRVRVQSLLEGLPIRDRG